MGYLDTWELRKRQPSHGQLNLKQQIQLQRQKEDRTLISGLDATTLGFYPDTSHWNGRINVAAMAPYISAIMAKCSDGQPVREGPNTEISNYVDDQFSDTVQQAFDLPTPIPVIAYHYWQPQQRIGSKANDRQYQALLYALRNKKPGVSFHGIRFDVEEPTDLFHGYVKDQVETYYAWALEDFGDKIPIDFYSRVGYLDQMPALRDWLAYKENPKEVHYAQWVWNTKTQATWTQVKTEILPKINMKVLNYAGWRALQFSARIYGMEGCGPGEIDLNVHNGTQAAMYAYHRFTPGANPPPPPPPPPPADTTWQAALAAHAADPLAHLPHTHPGHTHTVIVGPSEK